MSKKKWLLVIGVAFIAIIGASAMSGISPLEQEYNWYNDNGYSPNKMDYIDLLDSLPSAIVDEIQVSKESLRQRASGMMDEYGQVMVSWCPDEKILCVVGEFDPVTEVVRIYYWKP